MKLKLAAIALAFAAAPLAYANTQVPQPSFQDSAPVEYAPSGAAGTAIVHQFPQPSFQG